MKYAICDFSQAEITKFNDENPQYKLDPVDLLIFQWFIDFAAISNVPKKDGSKKKGMWKKIVDDTEYYYINYNALIDEFPILGYQSIRQIQRRFEKYVTSGLLVKKTFHEGRKGSFSYFGFTEKLISLKYDDSNLSQKINPHKADASLTDDKNDMSKTDTDDRNVMSKVVTDDRNVVSKAVIDDKNVMSKVVTDDRNVMCFKRNSTTNLKNSATNSPSTETKPENPKTEAAEYSLFEKTKQLFGYDVEFTPNPYPGLVKKLQHAQVQ